MIRGFRELESRMHPERLARSDAKAKEILTEMLMAEIRKQTGLSQRELRSMLADKDIGSESEALEEH